jgi:hypothetical protein
MNKYSPCGMDCRECEAFIATQNNDIETLKRHQVNYLEQFGKELSLEELKCDGCLSKGRQISFCAICEIRNCALTQGYSTCAQCPQFPCEKGSFIWQEGSISLKNLQSIR